MTIKWGPKAKRADKVDKQRRKLLKLAAAGGAGAHHIAVDVSVVARGAQNHQDRADHAGNRPDRRIRRTLEVGCRGGQQVFG